MEHRDPNLSQAYRDAAHPEPSSALDARILDAARQAVAKPAARHRPSWFVWAVPFSSVVVLVLGVTLLLDMQQRAPEVLESPTATPPAIRLDIPEAPPVQVVKPAPVEIPAEPGESPRHHKSVESAPPVAGPVRTRPEVPLRPSSPASSSANPGAVAMPAPVPQPYPAQSATEPPRAPTQADARPVPESARAVGVTGNLAEPSTDAMSPPPPARAAERAGASAPGNSTEMRKAAQPAAEGPERLVETIRRLIREGRLDQARVTLEKLRQTYPGFDVPEDLKGAVGSTQ